MRQVLRVWRVVKDAFRRRRVASLREAGDPPNAQLLRQQDQRESRNDVRLRAPNEGEPADLALKPVAGEKQK